MGDTQCRSKHLWRKGWKSEKKERKERTFIHQSIEARSKGTQGRRQIGYWEGDLTYSSCHKLYVVTLVGRCSLYLLTGISSSRKAEEVERVIRDLPPTVPPECRQTLTLDRGLEFAEHRLITEAIPSLQVYFAHPVPPCWRSLQISSSTVHPQVPSLAFSF